MDLLNIFTIFMKMKIFIFLLGFQFVFTCSFWETPYFFNYAFFFIKDLLSFLFIWDLYLIVLLIYKGFI